MKFGRFDIAAEVADGGFGDAVVHHFAGVDAERDEDNFFAQIVLLCHIVCCNDSSGEFIGIALRLDFVDKASGSVAGRLLDAACFEVNVEEFFNGGDKLTIGEGKSGMELEFGQGKFLDGESLDIIVVVEDGDIIAGDANIELGAKEIVVDGILHRGDRIFGGTIVFIEAAVGDDAYLVGDGGFGGFALFGLNCFLSHSFAEAKEGEKESEKSDIA